MKTKKIVKNLVQILLVISILIQVIMPITSIATESATVRLSTSKESINVGESVDVNIYISGKISYFSGFFEYDTDIFEEAEKNDITLNPNINTEDETYGFWKRDYAKVKGKDKIIIQELYFRPYDMPDGGLLATIKLTAKKAAETTSIKINNINLVDENVEDVLIDSTSTDVKITEKAEETIKYNVNYNVNTEDTVTNIPSTEKVEKGTKYNISETIPTREGYVFKNWNTLADGTGNAYLAKDEIEVNGDITLYAQWEKAKEDVEKHKISYIANTEDEVSNIPENIEVEKGKEYIISETVPTRKDYMFKNWNTVADGTGTKYSPKDKVQVDSDITLYAQWEKITEQEKLYLKSSVYEIGEENINEYDDGDKYISKVNKETKLSTFIENLYTNGEIKVYKKDGTEVLDKDTYVGTQMKLEITKDKEKIEVTIIVTGDIDGNGKVTVTDLSELNKAIIGDKELNEACFKAIDLDKNGKVTVTDLSELNKIIVE